MPSPQCPRCGREHDASSTSCQRCGQALRQAPPLAARRCAGCGAEVDPGFRFCGHCGMALADPAPPPPADEPPPLLQRVARPAGPPASDPPDRGHPPDLPSPAQAPPAPTHETAAEGSSRGLRLVPVRHDGVPGTPHPLGTEGATCGRLRGELRFADDPTVSPEHARFTVRADAVFVEDLGSLNGTFIRLRAPRPLASGDDIRLGRQLLRVAAITRPPEGTEARPWGSPDVGYRARLAQLLDGGGAGEVFPLREGENAIGREAGEICFPHDRYVSARHARIDVSEAGVVLTDLGSSNGTFVRISGPAQVTAGDQILVGMRLMRVEGA